jgi:hypothetical protein
VAFQLPEIQVKPTVEENDRYGESYDGFGI